MTGVIVNIRPETYRERFHQAFAPIGWNIVDSPVLVPESLHAALPDPQGYDAVIFTSQVAIDALRDQPGWRGKIAYAVGPATADAARRAGFAQTVQTGLDARDLAAYLVSAGFKQALYLSAEDVSADVSLDDPLRIRRLAVYRMSPSLELADGLLQAVRAGGPVVVPLFSRRSARALEKLLKEAGITAQNAHLSAVSISADVLAPDAGPWQRRAVADKPTLEAVVAKTAAVVANMTSEAQ
ncbi:MAG: uroporphyrinogen-III synthase [Rhodospirillaceae bacterium]|nr:uroporphyrinogen-III synthase [Rhodospirillaceae bacterium]